MAITRAASGMLLLAAVFFGSGCYQARPKAVAAPQQSTDPRATKQAVSHSERSEPAGQDSGGLVIGHLKTRDKMITIRTGPDGPLYTVESEDGKILAVDLPAAELSAKFPELKDVVERGIAGEDASIDPRYEALIIEHNE